MDVKQHMTKDIYELAKSIIMKDVSMMFYGMQFPKDVAPDNSVLLPIVFESKSFTSTKTCYSNIEREGLGILHGLENSTITALPMRLA